MARGKGASDQRLLTPLPGKSGEIAGDPRMGSKSRVLYVFFQQKLLIPQFYWVFLILFIILCVLHPPKKHPKSDSKSDPQTTPF